MSKSLENIVPLRQAVAKFGADPLRLGVLATAELNQDTDFSPSLATTIQERLVNLIQQSRKLGRKKTGRTSYSTLDRWMLSRLNASVQAATAAMERLRVREVVNIVLYHLENDAAWYQRRLGAKKVKGDSRNHVLRQVFDLKAKILAPLAPHVAEEMWAALGNKGLVAKAEWPKPNDKLADRIAEASESVIKDTLEDTSEILKATGLTPKRITYYVAAPWKWRIYQRALKTGVESQPPQGNFIRDVMSEPEIRSIGRPAADFASKAIRQATQMKGELRNARVGLELKEMKILEDAKNFLSREFKAEIQVGQEGEKTVNDPKDRARSAEPYRPAIFIE
jgi:leucyl-tRNA synthetase